MTDETKQTLAAPQLSTEKIDPQRATECFTFNEQFGPVLVFRRPLFSMTEAGMNGVPIVTAAVAIPWPVAHALHQMLGKTLEDAEAAQTKASQPNAVMH